MGFEAQPEVSPAQRNWSPPGLMMKAQLRLDGGNGGAGGINRRNMREVPEARFWKMNPMKLLSVPDEVKFGTAAAPDNLTPFTNEAAETKSGTMSAPKIDSVTLGGWLMSWNKNPLDGKLSI